MKGRKTHRGSLLAVGGGAGRLAPNYECDGEVRRLYLTQPYHGQGRRVKLPVGWYCAGCREVSIDHGAVPVLISRGRVDDAA